MRDVQCRQDPAAPLRSVSTSPPRIAGRAAEVREVRRPFAVRAGRSARAPRARVNTYLRALAPARCNGRPARGDRRCTSGSPSASNSTLRVARCATTLRGSPSATVSLTSAPAGFASATARLSWLLIVSEVPGPSVLVVTVAMSVSRLALLDRRRGRLAADADGEHAGLAARAERTELRCDREAVSSAYQPVQPDSVNGLPPSPVAITSGFGPPRP